MMFLSHIGFALELIALTAGAGLFFWAKHEKDPCEVFTKAVGAIVIVFSVIGLICSIYSSVAYWRAGYFHMPFNMMKTMTQQDMMKNQGN